MDKRKEKLNCQLRLIAALKEFTGPVQAAQFTQKEFYIVRLQIIGSVLEELKRERLRGLSDWLTARMARGSLSEADAARFKDSLAQLVNGQDYNSICAALSGSKELLLERLSRVSPLSESEEEKKRPGQFREPESDRLTSGAYTKMGFDKLETEIGAGRTEDEVLALARERVAKYCSIDNMPLGMDNTMPSPTLTCIEAVTGACFRLLARLKH
jgi:hypothetical protein